MKKLILLGTSVTLFTTIFLFSINTQNVQATAVYDPCPVHTEHMGQNPGSLVCVHTTECWIYCVE